MSQFHAGCVEIVECSLNVNVEQAETAEEALLASTLLKVLENSLTLRIVCLECANRNPKKTKTFI
jgi:hypothetical protein